MVLNGESAVLEYGRQASQLYSNKQERTVALPILDQCIEIQTRNFTSNYCWRVNSAVRQSLPRKAMYPHLHLGNTRG